MFPGSTHETATTLHAIQLAADRLPEESMKIEKTCQMPFPTKQVYSAWASSNTVISPASTMEIDPVLAASECS